MNTFQAVAVTRLYRMIADQIAGRIRAGDFPRGGRRPSERELAEQLQVSRASIREALIALEIEGYVEVRVGTGVFVTATRESAAPFVAGQAAPLRLRLYELKKDTAFGRADYFALTDNAQSTLGGDLVEQDEFLLRPGEERRIERTLDEQTRQLGFVAAYRDLDRATWRQVLDVPGQRTSHLDITLGAQAIGIVARPAP